MLLFDPWYFIYLAPALLLGMWAQFRVKSAYASAAQVAAPLSGAAAARHVLDSAGLNQVGIEQIGGQLTDHYDPSHRVLRLSHHVFNDRSMAAVGIAAHEAGHAIQHARHYAPLVVRNLAVPAANFGSGLSTILLIAGLVMSMAAPSLREISALLLWGGIGLFGAVVFFQLVNLPVEFDASNRAKAELVSLGIVDAGEMGYVNKVLNAAAWTYVAATLQAILTLLYLIMRFAPRSND